MLILHDLIGNVNQYTYIHMCVYYCLTMRMNSLFVAMNLNSVIFIDVWIETRRKMSLTCPAGNDDNEDFEVNANGSDNEWVVVDSSRSRLVLIDLAGSERVKRSGVTGKAMDEAKNINQSLSALGNVMAALQSKQKHIPFRDSTLTYLLHDCLGTIFVQFVLYSLAKDCILF
ncbi:hypothetical protein RFI_12975 [Reticulomyxa filosa]|uniref:Kinesin motor domain-containing protein n=1 Tax=Reticulomyxa filosa TaxID=46433 RepID=X6NEJ4_RETFI|nr:hypothetical protein RFI_12975 [Reticulomyxa filosa]|eukprot:ETO24184.1 hypothetical protein RFI_12975 [Reticulomyxa filosa]